MCSCTVHLYSVRGQMDLEMNLEMNLEMHLSHIGDSLKTSSHWQ